MHRGGQKKPDPNPTTSSSALQESLENVKGIKHQSAKYASASDKKKPKFPAYTPSHMDANKSNKDDKYKKEMYDSNHIYVTNLPENANMEEIHQVFPNCVGITLGVNETNESNAAFVEFPSPHDAKAACIRSRGSSIRGNTLIVCPKLKFN